jgi:hypothetical protein
MAGNVEALAKKGHLEHECSAIVQCFIVAEMFNLQRQPLFCQCNVSGCRLHDIGLGDLYKTHNYKMENTFFDRLLIEAQELATKTNALNDFMRTQNFVGLDRQNKDLLYKQSRLMNEYLQILGQRIELLGEKFSFKQ